MEEFKQRIGNKNLIATTEKELEPQLSSLFMVLEKLGEGGIKNDLSIQIGWAVYYLDEVINGWASRRLKNGINGLPEGLRR